MAKGWYKDYGGAEADTLQSPGRLGEVLEDMKKQKKKSSPSSDSERKRIIEEWKRKRIKHPTSGGVKGNEGGGSW